MAVEGRPGRPLRSQLLVPVLVMLGTLLIQSAWSLALPPFRGTDEFDHAFRAASVADGQWVSHWGAAPHGRGVLVRAPRSLVAAASPVCRSYEYTRHDNCFPARDLGGGDVEVASASTAYNPIFYWVTGKIAQPFTGATALYVMRAVTALICALLIGLASWALTLWARSGWPLVSLGVAFTPVAWFSVSIMAPNGVEIAAALAMWSALIGLATERGRAAARPLLVVATVAGVVICLVRPLGPLWIGLAVLATLGLVGPPQTWQLVRRRRRLLGWCVAAMVVSGLGALAWTRVSGGVPLGGFPQAIDPLGATLGQVPLWYLQGIAAFPRRGDPAPLAVYALVGLSCLAFVALAFRVAGRGQRFVLVGCLALALVVPFVFTLMTIRTSGWIWQGRYGMPFHLGVFVIAGLVLDSYAVPRRRATATLGAGWLAVLAANVVSVVAVFEHESAHSPLAGTSEWVTVPSWVLALLVTVGFVALAFAARQMSVSPDPAAVPGVENALPARASDSVTA
jgi:hypothetical protein